MSSFEESQKTKRTMAKNEDEENKDDEGYSE